ncbi:uncharacterized protein Dyak_GE26190, isoform C [Drosophila yakuba]|uniref:Uncharacterized protein, isoform C n=1 Tax=Drosophila yakuba TaxID=7245 RepID=A0A0R1E758_DROYA|nr:uncharacterized protein Dyak_GE26190, isoform C [Drosophila yakuba]
MSSSVFTEAPSARPAAAEADSNLVVVYSKNGISFDERAIGNIMEEKSISTISVVRITSPTPSMVDQEEAERLEELANFMDTATDSELDSDNGSQSGGDDASELDEQDEENHNTGDDHNSDSTETEADAPRTRRRVGRKPKAIKKRKRRRPKERPQIVGLRVEQFYADSTADMVVKNALKLAGVSVYKRTAETDALMEVIRNDHNYTPFTSPEQLKNHKRAEKMAMEMQAQSRKIIMQAPGNVKLINAKKRVQAIPFSPVQVKVQRLPVKPHQVQQPAQLQTRVQLIRKPIQSPLPRQKPEIIASNSVNARQRPARAPVKVIAPVQEYIEDDDDAQSSDPAEEENADKSYDSEEMSDESDDFQESDNDRDSDMDFDMRHSSGRNPNKRKRVRKVVRQAQTKPMKPLPPPPPTQQHFPELKKRKETIEPKAPQIGQIIQLPVTKAAPTVIALGRGLPSTSFLKIRPTHQSLPVKKPPLPTPPANSSVRRMPAVQLGRIVNSPQEVKEIIINKNMASPKGVFTNLNTLLGENNNATTKSSPDPLRHRAVMSPSTPRSSYNQQMSPIVVPVPAQAHTPSKGFMPIGVDTAQSHKLPAQIVIETHQSSSELAAENDKQLDLINSIVQDELLKSNLVEQPVVNADEDIPKLVKMLESTAADLDTPPVSLPTQSFPVTEMQGVGNPAVADPNDIMDTADEDEITADFLQHVVGLIEEDKQFEAEVVKQVLASAEPGTLDGIVSLPVDLPQVQAQTNLLPNASLAEPAQSMTSLPIACSTPSRSVATSLPPSAKVVRGNGRVIYLPPIEAPTTRAKRRAQFPAAPGMATTSNSDAGNMSFGESSLDASINQLLNASSLSNDSQSGSGPKRPNPREPSLARRSTAPRRSKKLDTSQNNDPDASESQEDDDDPNKLWCVCRQPHNNRFMICCDLCEDWFHGTCVGVTKAMGTDMENKGIDWKCPKCVKRQEERSQPRITDMLVTRPTPQPEERPIETKVLISTAELVQVTTPSTPRRTLPMGVTVSSSPMRIPMVKPAKKFPAGTIPHQQQQLNFIRLGPSPANRISETLCLVCKRPASPSSDRKNRTLFEKICAKQVEPKQLVRMTPEQLASQELAKWREEENRHQLDMIKKSELDMLACAQNYVVKTHKGEEVIATKVDVTLPEEDVNEPSTADTKQTSLVSDPDTSTLERSTSREKSGSSKEKRHKSHKHHHRKRSRSRSNSRGRSVDKRHRRHHNEGESGGGEREHRSREKQSKERDEVVPSPLPKKRDENDQSPVPKKIAEKKTEASAYNLVDQILDSEKTVEQAANLGKPKPSPKPLPTLPSSLKAPEPMDNYSRYVQGLTTSSLWSGTLKMIDLADFEIVMYPVRGNCHQLGKLMPSQMDVIGRITRVNVWEYIKKLKKSPTKEVVIVNIFPASPSETFKFDLFFEYLDSRQRLGVLGVDSDQIRDFYIFPLGSGDKLPPALQTAEPVPFYDEAQRPNTLLGIIVRCLSKRPAEAPPSTPSVPSPVPATSSKVAKKSRSTTLYTGQSSPKRKTSTHSTSSKDDEFDIDAIIKAPIAKLQKTAPKVVPLPPVPNDADEPYSPGGSDDELVQTAPRKPNDLERQVNEINKQIAAQQMEIAGLLKVEPTGSASSSNVLSAISIPPNLSKILASIKDKTDLPSNADEGDEEYNPEDAITTTRSFASKPKSKGRLAHLSEAELLSMVPDNLADVIPSSSRTRHQLAQTSLSTPPPPPPPGV